MAAFSYATAMKPENRSQNGGEMDYGLGRSVQPVWVRLAEQLERELVMAAAGHQTFYRSAPAATLNALLAIPDAYLTKLLRALRPVWLSAAETLTEAPDLSVWSAANSASHFVFRASGDPNLSTGFVRSLAPGLRDFPALSPTSIETLRDPTASTSRKLEAAAGLISEVNVTGFAVHLQNAVYRQCFAWPLLVTKLPGTSGVSLPVAIDVALDGAGDCETLLEGRAIDTTGWSVSFPKVVAIAKELWQSKHGNYFDFRQKIQEASVEFDFSVAEAIVRDQLELVLTDPSMEPYFVQAILTKLLGVAPSTCNAVTGIIGQRLADLPGQYSNHRLEWPGGVPAKLDYALTTGSSERLVVPVPRTDEQHTERRTIQNRLMSMRSVEFIETNFVETLHDVCDCVQPEGWRQFRYVRCPDVQWMFHHATASPVRTVADARESFGRSLADRLKFNTGCVLTVSGDEGKELLSTLWTINTVVRTQSKNSGLLPMMSWTFVRTTEQEADEMFWWVVWDAIGASRETFALFCASATADEASERLAAALNRMTPVESRVCHRAPDLLVILGGDRLRPGPSRPRRDLTRHPFFSFDLLIGLLNRRALLSANHLADVVGRTRIIVVDEDLVSGPGIGDQKADRSRNASVGADVLAVFRFGFTHPMASMMLRDQGHRHRQVVRLVLRALVRSGDLGYTGGQYFCIASPAFASDTTARDEIAATEPPTRDELRAQAVWNYRAGLAHAPYLSPYPVPGLALDRAFSAEFVHEASYHLTIALRYASRAGVREIEIASRDALRRLNQFLRFPSWGLVDLLNRSRSTVETSCEMAEELIRAADGSGQPIPPGRWVNAARSWQEYVKRSLDADRVERAKERIEELYSLAEAACHGTQEEDYWRTLVWSHQSLWLRRSGSTSAERDEAAVLFFKVGRLLRAGTDGSAVFGEWYEVAGDDERSHQTASELYRLGTQWKPDWHQLWLKRLGATSLGYREQSPAFLRELLPSTVQRILGHSYRAFHREVNSDGAPEHVRLRWLEGLKLIDRQLGTAPEVMRALRNYRRNDRVLSAGMAHTNRRRRLASGPG